MKKEQIKCPNCSGFKTTSASSKTKIMSAGAGFMFLGGILTLFFLWILGIPLLLIGFIMIFIGMAKKETGEMSCRNCNFNFRDENLAKKGEQEAKDFFKIKFRIK